MKIREFYYFCQNNVSFMDIKRFDDTFDFITCCGTVMLQNEIEAYDAISTLASEISSLISRTKQKLPYHINLIDLIRANENAHSRILGAFLRAQSNGRYEILKSFVKTFFAGKFTEDIVEPIFINEKHRIDLLIAETGKYALIFENKIYNAVLQKNQLARYIEAMKNDGFSESQIYVMYLPSNEYNEPNACCWKSPEVCCDHCDRKTIPSECQHLHSYAEAFAKRFAYLTFRNDILPWLKDDILPNCKVKDTYLQSALMQYIDYLEGLFDLRITNHMLNMEIKEHIKQTLNLPDNPEQSYTSLKNKIEDVNKVLNQLNILKDEVEAACWQKWRDQLKLRYPDCKLIGNSEDRCHPNVGVALSFHRREFALLIETESDNIYYGIGHHYCSKDIEPEITAFVQPVLGDIGGFQKNEWWYGWKYTSFENGYERLCTLIDKVKMSLE